MFSTILLAVLAAMPAAYELDFGTLPPTNTVPYYEFTLIMSYKGEPDVKVEQGIGPKCSPEKAANNFFESLDDPTWKVKRDGLKITIYGYSDVPIQNLKVEGDGPKPRVRRVLIIPDKNKKNSD